MRDPHEVLGVPPDAPDTVIAAAYFDLAARFDPDSGSADPARAARWAEIEEAFAALSAQKREAPPAAKQYVEPPLTEEDIGLPDTLTPPPEQDEGLGIERALKHTATFLLIFAAGAYALYTLLRPFGLVGVMTGVSTAGYYGLRITYLFVPRRGETGRYGYQKEPSQTILNWEFLFMMMMVLSTLAVVMYQAYKQDGS